MDGWMDEFFGFGEDLKHKHPPKPQTNQPSHQEAKSTRQPQFCPGNLLSIGLKVSKVSFAYAFETDFRGSSSKSSQALSRTSSKGSSKASSKGSSWFLSG